MQGIFDLLSVGGKMNTYGGKSLKACMGLKELGGCLTVGGKAATRTFNVVESVFSNWVDCNVDTYSESDCMAGISTIGTQGSSMYWYTMETMDVCFGGKDAEEAEAEMDAMEEEDAEEFEAEAAQALFIM